MKRIFVLGIIVMTISSLALAENSAPMEISPKAYSLQVGDYKLIVVSPLDSQRSVLVGVQGKGAKKPDSYLAEGVLALAVSRLAKMTASPDFDKKVNKYARQMIQARALTMRVDTGAIKN